MTTDTAISPEEHIDFISKGPEALEVALALVFRGQTGPLYARISWDHGFQITSDAPNGWGAFTYDRSEMRFRIIATDVQDWLSSLTLLDKQRMVVTSRGSSIDGFRLTTVWFGPFRCHMATITVFDV